MDTDGQLNSFKEIMNEVFYDWGFSPNPQIRHRNDGWWINKTYLTKSSDGFYYLTYKTSAFLVSSKALEDFNYFYKNLFLDDLEFQEVLSIVEQIWDESSPVISEDSVIWGNLSIHLIDFKYQLSYLNSTKEINKRVYQKINKFINLLNK